jgi:hypothetical protein
MLSCFGKFSMTFFFSGLARSPSRLILLFNKLARLPFGHPAGPSGPAFYSA